jgi:hypothetical protein
MRSWITVLATLVSIPLLPPLDFASADELEFLFTPGRAVSLTNSQAQLPIGTKFELNSIKVALPGYDIRFFSADEQERTDQTLGAEGTGQDAFIISKNGRDLLRVFGYGLDDAEKLQNPHLADDLVILIEAAAGVIDATGATLGMPLNKAFYRDKATCYYDTHDRTCWSEQLPGISYVYDEQESCEVSYLSGDYSARLIPDCFKIVSIYLTQQTTP